MFNEKDKYQNILTQLHELNRNIVLNENEKMEQITQRIESLEEKIEKSSNNTNKKNNDKFFLSIIIITLFNTLLLLFILFTYNTEEDSIIKENNKETIQIEEKPKLNEKEINKTTIEENTNNEDVLSFNEKSIIAFEEDEEFVEIKPIIRKGTQYNCKDDENTYKIPYTVEIKGKLYSDKFKFILQENSETKECTILKEYM
ncbi:hypothetical protein [Arcobacter sp. LA11]|uniref:hypothetical protein n=1 Tax=Arcobacter sp. LA11 TaxID=1898176 RepID=UPI000933EAC2|nr:hypothetical protein [Arcobacter sp. LA11]